MTIGVGLMEVKGQAVKFSSSYQILGEDWVVSRIGGGTYYIYIDEGREVTVDSIPPEWNDTYMEYYHPHSQKRHGGTILTDTVSEKITQVINAGALVAGDIDTTTLETVYAIIAFSELDPTHGSHRVYIDRNEVSLQIYDSVAAAWTTYLKLGGDEAAYTFGNIFPYMQARGVIKTGAIAEANVLDVGDKNSTGKIYTFDSTLDDKGGTDPWTPAGNVGYEITDQKYGSGAFEATSDGVNTLSDADADGATFGADFGFDWWGYIGTPEASYENIFALESALMEGLNVSNTAYVATAVAVGYVARVTALSSTAIVAAWRDTDNDRTDCRVGTISGTTITWGTAATATSSNDDELGIAALSATKFALAYEQTGTLYGVIGEISGTTISFGTPVSLVAGGITVGVCALDATHFVVSYLKGTSDQYCIVGVVSGTTITFGAEYLYDAGTMGWNSVAAINATSFVLVTRDAGNSTTESVIGVVASDDEITFGATYQVHATKHDENDVKLLATDKIVTIYGNGTGMKVGTIANDDEITWGTEVVPTSGGASSFIGKLSDTSFFAVTYEDATTITTQLCTVAGTTITAKTEQTLQSGDATCIPGHIAYLEDNKAVAAYKTGAGATYEVVERLQPYVKIQVGDANKIKCIFNNGGTSEADQEETHVITSNQYQHISAQYDFSENDISFTVNDGSTSFTSVGLIATACGLTFTFPNTGWAIDDLLVDPTTFISVATSQAHYTSGQPWAADVDYDTDLLLVPKDGGKLYIPSEARWKVRAVASANYTVTDIDSFDVVRVTTGAADRTITLPTAADNVDRIITILKEDSGVGHVIIDGEGAETIQNAHASFTTIGLWLQGDVARLYCDGTGWVKLNPPSLHLLDESARTTGAWDHNANPGTAFTEIDFSLATGSALVPPGTVAVYGLVYAQNDPAGDHGWVLFRDATPGTETDTNATAAWNIRGAAIAKGNPMTIKAKNGIFDVAELAGNTVQGVVVHVWGWVS